MAAKTKFVQYHTPFAKSVTLNVLKEHKNGTLDIGLADGTVVVRGVTVADAPAHGVATWHTPPDEATAAALTATETIKTQLQSKTRSELIDKVVDFNATAPADKKIVIAPTVSQPELVEKLLTALTPTIEQ